MSFDFPLVLALRVILRTAEPQRLPPFLGSALHGALGRAVYRTVCAFPRREACPGCPLYARCAYPSLFEPPATDRDLLISAGIRDQAPRPLVLAPEPGWIRPSGNAFRLKAGEEVSFRLTLIGRAIDDLAIVVVALQAMARHGLGSPESGPSPFPAGRAGEGKGTDSVRDGNGGQCLQRRRAALRLLRVTTATGGDVIYDSDRDMFTLPPSQHLTSDSPLSTDGVVLDLVSPLRLKHRGKFATTVTPTNFLAALARRANALSLLYGNGRPAVDESAVASLASSLTADETALRLVHVRRYSARQRQRMVWPGLVGQMRWHGDVLPAVSPLLQFGELVQVGKGTALGFGRYQLPTA